MIAMYMKLLCVAYNGSSNACYNILVLTVTQFGPLVLTSYNIPTSWKNMRDWISDIHMDLQT